jgi:hypothetical protein
MRALTKADKDRGVKLRELGCIVCLLELQIFTPTAIHHIDGKTKPRCHQKTIGLCGRHHQVPDNEKPPRWFNFHGKRMEFELTYGTEDYLLSETNRLINEDS